MQWALADQKIVGEGGETAPPPKRPLALPHFIPVTVYAHALMTILVVFTVLQGKSKKVKSNYFIVRPKVDQRAGLLSLPHLGIFAIHTR